MNPELVAPCGMNCGVCGHYLASAKGIPKKRGKILHCTGCRIRNKQCAYIKGQCTLLQKKKIDFCFECPQFPCHNLEHLDQRYQKNYRASPIKNLLDIQERGMTAFLKGEAKKYSCEKCGGTRSLHNNKCYDCEVIESWRG